jgi:hypothetical protein
MTSSADSGQILNNCTLGTTTGSKNVVIPTLLFNDGTTKTGRLTVSGDDCSLTVYTNSLLYTDAANASTTHLISIASGKIFRLLGITESIQYAVRFRTGTSEPVSTCSCFYLTGGSLYVTGYFVVPSVLNASVSSTNYRGRVIWASSGSVYLNNAGTSHNISGRLGYVFLYVENAAVQCNSSILGGSGTGAYESIPVWISDTGGTFSQTGTNGIQASRGIRLTAAATISTGTLFNNNISGSYSYGIQVEGVNASVTLTGSQSTNTPLIRVTGVCSPTFTFNAAASLNGAFYVLPDWSAGNGTPVFTFNNGLTIASGTAFTYSSTTPMDYLTVNYGASCTVTVNSGATLYDLTDISPSITFPAACSGVGTFIKTAGTASPAVTFSSTATFTGTTAINVTSSTTTGAPVFTFNGAASGGALALAGGSPTVTFNSTSSTALSITNATANSVTTATYNGAASYDVALGRLVNMANSAGTATVNLKAGLTLTDTAYALDWSAAGTGNFSLLGGLTLSGSTSCPFNGSAKPMTVLLGSSSSRSDITLPEDVSLFNVSTPDADMSGFTAHVHGNLLMREHSSPFSPDSQLTVGSNVTIWGRIAKATAASLEPQVLSTPLNSAPFRSA